MSKILQTLPEQINGTFMILGKRIYFDKNKRSLKSKDNNNISADKEINFCEQYNVGLSKQRLKQNSIKELVVMIIRKGERGTRNH